MIEPEPGNLLLMPGYLIHESLPVDAAERRVCIAFDVRPAELPAQLAHPASVRLSGSRAGTIPGIAPA